MSLQGSIAMAGEESSRQLDLGAEIAADRITDDWKITFGAEIEHRREDFDLDEDEPLRAERSERDFDGLVARSLNDHWSVAAAAVRLVDLRQPRHPDVIGPAIETPSSRIRSTRADSAHWLRPGSVLRAVPRRDAVIPHVGPDDTAGALAGDRSARAMGIAAGRSRLLDVPSGCVAVPHPARGRGQRPARPRIIAGARGLDKPHPRSAVDSPARRDSHSGTWRASRR